MRRLAVVSCILLLTAGMAFAQLDRGSITGTVTDSTGALIPEVNVAIRNTATGALYPTVTTSSGQYAIPSLPVGTYEVAFERTGFKRLTRGAVELSGAEVRRVDATLEVGAISESVNVTAELPRLQTDTPYVATNLPNSVMVVLPLAIKEGGRTMQDLTFKIVPGVQGTGGWDLNVTGSPYYTIDSQLDGASVAAANMGRFDEAAVSMEAVGEFNVQTSAVSAEFGRSQGSVFSYIMKSGTNEIHGSAYGALRNEALNANTFANNFYGKKRAMDRKWNYAFSFGGPLEIPKVYKGQNKTFFYATYERYHENNLLYGSPSASYPIPDFYKGDFSRLLGAGTGYTDALGSNVLKGAIYDPNSFHQLDNGRWVGQMFEGNKIPVSRFSKVAQNLNAIASKYYVPTVMDASGRPALQLNAITPSINIPVRDEWKISTKVDHNFNDYHKLAGTFAINRRPRMNAYSSPNSLYSPDLDNGGPLSQAQAQRLLSPQVRLAYDWTMSPSTQNHFLVYFNRFRNFMYPPTQDIDGAKELGISGLSTPGYPTFNWGEGPFITLANPGYSNLYANASNTFGLAETLSKAHGRHFLKTGFDLVRTRFNDRGSRQYTFNYSPLATSIPNEAFSGNQTGYAFASYLLGIVDSGSIALPTPVGWVHDYIGAFVQDDYKVSNRLTLTLGVRWDYISPIYEARGRVAGWTPNKLDPISSLPGAYGFGGDCAQCTGQKYFGKNDLNNFAPRIGFAYRLLAKTTVRGAYAIFFQGQAISQQSGGSAIIAPWVQTWMLSASSVDRWRGLFNIDGGLPANLLRPPEFNASWGNTSQPVMFDPQYWTTPYTQRWNLNFQQEIAKNLVLDVGYAGVKGTRLVGNSLARPNQLPKEALTAFGRNLLNPVQSQADATKNGIPYPFPGFKGTVASALRQYPQVQGNSTITVVGAPLGFSNTQMLQVALDKRFSYGLTAYGSYVWSKTLTNVTTGAGGGRSALDYYNLQNEKSVAAFDVPHAVKVYLAYELPIGKGKPFWTGAGKVANGIFGGWSISAVANYFSGLPLAFTGASSPLSNGWNGGQRINIASGEMLASGFSKSAFDFANVARSSNTYLNKAIYSDPALLTLGTAAPYYTQARGFGVMSEDISLAKNHRISEKYRVQLRADFINAFNRSTLGGIIVDVKNPLFGQATSITGNRQIQLEARLDF